MTHRTITLFSDRRETPRASSAFVASIVVHIAATAFLSFGVLYNPDVNTRVLTERYTVRHLDLHAKETETHSRPPSTVESALLAATKPAKDSTAGVPRRGTAQSIPGAGAASQLLVQPNARLPLELKEEIPVPNVVLWMPGHKTPATIVPPERQKLSAAETSPSLQAPNEESNLSDLGISSTKVASQKQEVAAGTTTPLVVHSPNPAQGLPQSATQAPAQPAPAAVMSLSQLHMNDGLVTLPEVNEGSGKRAEKLPGAEAGNADIENKTASPAGGAPAAKTVGPAAVSAASAGAEKDGSVSRIDLPKDGQFGAVVVGSSLEEKYPETADLWTGRMAYTVYLHVGLAKSWILQYSLPRSAEAAAGGNIARIEAPWPYNIVRPDIPPGAINADALMVHGYVNEAGRFENLAVAFPPDFAQSQFVLATLAQWQFRPARQNGQNARVEVLLIIPEVQ